MTATALTTSAHGRLRMVQSACHSIGKTGDDA
jgi:hypothetical protein